MKKKKDPVSTESLTRLQSEASMAFTTYDNILSSSQMKQSHSTKQPSKSHITLNNKLRQEFIKNIININTKNIQPNEFLSQIKSSIFKLENHESKYNKNKINESILRISDHGINSFLQKIIKLKIVLLFIFTQKK